jgi:hypothetical protein
MKSGNGTFTPIAAGFLRCNATQRLHVTADSNWRSSNRSGTHESLLRCFIIKHQEEPMAAAN